VRSLPPPMTNAVTELPDSELNARMLTVTEAADLGSSGEALNGYRCLLAGMERVEELREDGEPLAAELAARYRLALDHYGVDWGPRIERGGV